MKLFNSALLALALVLSLNANASVGPNSSWEEIKSAPGYIAGFSTIFFNYEGVTVDELCIDGDNLRPINPYKTVCVKFPTKDHPGSIDCLQYDTVYLSTPRAHTEERCVKFNPKGDDCRAYESFPAVYPTSYNVTVYKLNPRGEMRDAFTKQFDLPACK